MILVDANLLVYAHVASFPQHQRARTWLDGRINAAAPVGLPWPSLLAFVRIVSNPRVFDRPVAVSAAWRQAESWLATQSVWVPLPTERHQAILAPLMASSEGRANLVPDAHLAALGHRARPRPVLDGRRFRPLRRPAMAEPIAVAAQRVVPTHRRRGRPSAASTTRMAIAT